MIGYEGSFEWYQDRVMADLQKRVGEALLRAAVFFHARHSERISTPNTGERRTRARNTVAGGKGSSYTVYPNPSKPGEYMRKVTGHGRGNLVYEPSTVQEVARLGEVRIGFMSPARYMLTLELHRQRKGLRDSARELTGELNAVVTAEAAG